MRQCVRVGEFNRDCVLLGRIEYMLQGNIVCNGCVYNELEGGEGGGN